MLDATIIACNLGQESKPSRRMKYFENGQGTYQILVNTQLGGKVIQIHGI
jgi:hypothetical protein